MRKLEVLKRIVETGITAVVRAKDETEAEKISAACIAGGISSIEITFTVDGAENVISSLRKKFSREELIVGAGTVLDAETARIAILRGAEFIVSPAFNPEVAALQPVPGSLYSGVHDDKRDDCCHGSGGGHIESISRKRARPQFHQGRQGPLPRLT